MHQRTGDLLRFFEYLHGSPLLAGAWTESQPMGSGFQETLDRIGFNAAPETQKGRLDPDLTKIR